MLVQPVSQRLAAARRVLVAGCGGGYDIVGAVPLVAELRAAGAEVHLASLSFANLPALAGARADAEVPSLHAVDAAAASEAAYCPEAWLAQFLDERLGGRHVVHCFEKTGVVQLAAAYRRLVATLGIDAVVLVDGGIDALLRGDERSIGTPSEDLATLCAVAELDVPVRVLACVGLGSELRDGISHADAFARMAAPAERGAYLGASAVVGGTPAGDLYLAAVDHIARHQAGIKQSHVHACVSASARGAFGARGPHVWLSPLTSMFWFFDAAAVIADHLFLPFLAATTSMFEVSARVEAARKEIAVRGPSAIPL